MKKMIAAQAFEYRSVSLKPGDEFDCDDEHVHVLELTGRARRWLDPLQRLSGDAAPRQQYATRVLTADRLGRRAQRRERKPRA